MIDRVSPHNVDVEQALLGAILVNNEAFYRVYDFLRPAHFYEPIHREIYEVAGRSSGPARRRRRTRSRPICQPNSSPT